MKPLLALITLILLTGCEPSKPIHYKYALGTKVLLKLGQEGVVIYHRGEYKGVPYYSIKFRQKHTSLTRTIRVYEYEIEKKIR